MLRLAIVTIYENTYISAFFKTTGKEVQSIIRLGNGVEVEIEGVKIFLDPRIARGLSFVSHAHSDHLPRKMHSHVWSTPETKGLSHKKFTPLEYGHELKMDGITFRFLPAGHMLGSAQIVIENGFKLIYSGDLKLEGGFTAEPAHTEKCDILILESTFGSPFYRFPPKEEVAGEIKDWVERIHSKGKTPLLLAYSLGKAQEAVKILSSSYRVELHPIIYANCRRYEKLGVELGEYFPESSRKEDRVLIYPPRAKTPNNVEKAYLSGWALHPRMKRVLKVEEAFPLSDHSDFNSLLEYVNRVSPQVIYTFHGFAEELAEELIAHGYYAQPLSRRQSSLDSFI